MNQVNKDDETHWTKDHETLWDWRVFNLERYGWFDANGNYNESYDSKETKMVVRWLSYN